MKLNMNQLLHLKPELLQLSQLHFSVVSPGNGTGDILITGVPSLTSTPPLFVKLLQTNKFCKTSEHFEKEMFF